MKLFLTLTLAALLSTSPAWVSAETILNKCTDGKLITYTDKPCGKLGLTDAGPIKNTVTIVPVFSQTEVPRNKSREEDVSKAVKLNLQLDKTLN